MNSTTIRNNELLPNRSPDGITRDPTRALAEPSHNGMLPSSGVWSTRAETRNLQTGVRFSGLPAPASVSQTSNQCNETQFAPSAELDNGKGGWDEFLASIDWEEPSIQDLNNEENSDEDDFFAPNGTTRPTIQRQIPPHRTRSQRVKGPALGIKIASLNMRGRKCTTGPYKGRDKFNLLKKWMKENKVTILALIDTHWDEAYEANLRARTKSLQIYCSHESSNRGGIAFIVDVSVWTPLEINMTNLIQGRSALIRVQYARDVINIATIYVPNKKEEKIDTLNALRNKLRNTTNLENLVLTGDFNMVESDEDRRPTHPDDPDIVNAMNRLKIEFELIDGWRRANPYNREHTWSGHTNDDVSFARIDRIYVSETISQRTNEWEIIDTTKSLTDHRGVAVKILEPEAPFIGKGEQRFNINILDHPHYRANAAKALTKLETELQNYYAHARHLKKDEQKLVKLRTKTNPQKTWIQYKKCLMVLSKEASQIRRKSILKESNELERKRRAIIARPANLLPISIQKEIRLELDTVERQLSELKERYQTKAEDTSSAKWFKENEQGSKAWFAIHKEKHSAQIFYSLRDKEGDETRNTDEMMEIAKTHHETLQSHQPMTPEREEAIDNLLNKVKQKINKEHSRLLEKRLTYDEIKNTIKASKNGKSPGCDGIPNEVWKDEVKMYEKAEKEGEQRPDLVKLLKIVLLDVDKHGPIDHSFAEARMSLLYKKKDIRDIENYRPITLLNTDYKIYTTILTKRLREAAPSIINTDQAGFMPKRSIYDQTKLLEMMIKLCENKSQNGIILALDQEKAYDRIDHAYLWKAMKKYGIPDVFIKRVKNLYENARTAIRLNGCTTNLFDILRGVRQGDPLSCLLYNIAIEPLFESIRLSPLKGLKISDETFNALVSAYADDTTIYLSELDSLNDLNKCIDTFCKASTARFNEQKTEIIPVGDEEYRQEIVETRRFNDAEIDASVKIAKDGEAIRILGSWQGNGANANHKWNEIIEKQLSIMKMWARSYPSILARVRIAKALIASRALYRMTVNGIPSEYLKTMEKNIRSFIWLGKRGTIAWERAIQSKREGGIGAPSMTILYEATKVMWLKRWMTSDKERPKWAGAINEILVGARASGPTMNPTMITEWVEQKWKSKINIDSIPQSLRELLRAAKQYNLKISVVRAPMGLKLQMPAFSHPGRMSNRRENTKRSKCLRKNHAVVLTGDLAAFANDPRLDEDEIECPLGTEGCKEYAKSLLNSLGEVWNPYSRYPVKQKNYHTPRRLKLYEDLNMAYSAIEFNPDPLDQTTPRANVRIFGIRSGYLQNPKSMETPRKPLRTQPNQREVNLPQPLQVYVSGTANHNGWENSSASISNWYGHGDSRNCVQSISMQTQTRPRAELAAILLALCKNKNTRLTIKSSSLATLKAICYETAKWEDKHWHRIPDADLLKTIIHKLRTRPEPCSFKWARTNGNDTEQGMIEAKKLAKSTQMNREELEVITRNQTNSRALHDGARLSSLEMKDVYGILIDLRTSKTPPLLHPERLETAKNSAETATGLRPTNLKLIAGIWKLPVYPRLRDLLWNSLIGRLKVGKYWQRMTGYEERSNCVACKQLENTQQIEDETHLWVRCENNGQNECWRNAKQLWQQCTSTTWPEVNIGTIWGIGAFRFTNEEGKINYTTDSERFGTMASLAAWAIWKARNERAMNPDRLTNTESASLIFKEVLKDIIRKSWISTNLEPDSNRQKREEKLRALWGNNSLAVLERGKPPIFGF